MSLAQFAQAPDKSLTQASILNAFKVPDEAIKLLQKEGIKVKLSLNKMNFVKGGEVLSKVENISAEAVASLSLPGANKTPDVQQIVDVQAAVAKAFMEATGSIPDCMGDIKADIGKSVFAEALHEEASKTMIMGSDPAILMTKEVVHGIKPGEMHMVHGAEKVGKSGWNYDAQAAAAVDKMVGTVADSEELSATQEVKFSPIGEKFMTPQFRVKLVSAHQLYQPVYASSEGSCYFLIAANEELKIAARYKGQQLSIRAESPTMAKYAGLLGEVLEAGSKTTYFSRHFSVVNDQMAAKTLGAVVMLLAGKVQFKTPMPMVMKIKGKGA